MIPCPRIESFSSFIESESKPVRRWVKDDHKEPVKRRRNPAAPNGSVPCPARIPTIPRSTFAPTVPRLPPRASHGAGKRPVRSTNFPFVDLLRQSVYSRLAGAGGGLIDPESVVDVIRDLSCLSGCFSKPPYVV